jgi:Domain of unknown function (DUF1707)/Cell wall-active antibiotics response 4TMS YvqF
MSVMEPAGQRISDEERRQVAEVLREAAAQGRISFGELDERLEVTLAAKTYADLAPVTSDLPAVSTGELPTPLSRGLATAPQYDKSFASMSTTRRQGRWRLGAHHKALAVMGGVVLDLREALLTSPEVTIQASTFMGSVDVIVDEHTVVVCDGHAFMGDYSEKRSKLPSDPHHGSPVVRVQGRALMGRVNVKRRPGRASQ